MKKLLIERISNIEVPKPTLIESIEKNDGRLIIKNVLVQRADSPNRNGRVYPRRVLERSLDEHMNIVRNKMSYGELDHPLGESEANVLSMKNVAQAIMDIRWKGDEVFADIEILKTPMGNIVREILLAGYRVGQSSRGLGSVEPLKEVDGHDIMEVQDDFSIVAMCDIVSFPSTISAEMSLNESVNNQKLTEHKTHKLIRDIICELSGVCCLPTQR